MPPLGLLHRGAALFILLLMAFTRDKIILKGGELMDFSQYTKVKEIEGTENLANMLYDGWELLSVAPGTKENTAYFLYCVGWRDPIDRLGL